MTDSQLDTFFIATLNNIYQDLTECYEYTKNIALIEHTEIYEEYIEINKDHLETLDLISQVLQNCKTIDDFSEQDYETIDIIYDCISTYADNFIIPAQEPEHTEALKEYDKLEELLDLFLDDDSEEEF